MYTYEEVTNEYLGEVFFNIKRTDESGTETFIPVDESNSDYQEYLAWKDAQNGSA